MSKQSEIREIKKQIKEIENKQKEFKRKFKVIKYISFDWREMDDITASEFKRIIRSLGGYMYNNPIYEGSDMYGFIISKNPISNKDLRNWKKMDHELMELEEKLF